MRKTTLPKGTGTTVRMVAINKPDGSARTQYVLPVVVLREPVASDSVQEEFDVLASQWHKETRYWSSATKMAMHPAYQGIIALGRAAVPLILRDLERTRSHWLWALYILSKRQDPAPDEATFDKAVDAWLEWGRRQGLLT